MLIFCSLQVLTLFAAALLEKQIAFVCSNLVGVELPLSAVKQDILLNLFYLCNLDIYGPPYLELFYISSKFFYLLTKQNLYKYTCFINLIYINTGNIVCLCSVNYTLDSSLSVAEFVNAGTLLA